MVAVQPTPSRYDKAYDAIVRLCNQALAGDDLFEQVSARLRTVVDFRTAGWLRVDPMTLLPMPGMVLQAGHDHASRFIHNEYFEPDVAKFRDIARRQVPVQSLWEATGGEPDRSRRYRDILRRVGYGDDLRMVFRGGAASWGVACLARAESDPPFSRTDITFVARLCEPVAHALRLSHLLAGDQPAARSAPGVLILSDDGLVSMTDAAQRWLAQLPVDGARGLDLPAAVLSAASHAQALAEKEPGAEVPTARVRTIDGAWLRLSAARLSPGPAGTGQTAIILEPATLADLSPLVLELHGLTSREREITQLLLRGLPTRQIAEELFISRHTLSDHMKAIFAKLGVGSRPELTALLLDHTLPTSPRMGSSCPPAAVSADSIRAAGA
jgi:DNA-binding CsgD family transcriptional regulator